MLMKHQSGSFIANCWSEENHSMFQALTYGLNLIEKVTLNQDFCNFCPLETVTIIWFLALRLMESFIFLKHVSGAFSSITKSEGYFCIKMRQCNMKQLSPSILHCAALMQRILINQIIWDKSSLIAYTWVLEQGTQLLFSFLSVKVEVVCEF